VVDLDLGKSIINLKKHGIPFEEAVTIFGDNEGLKWEDLQRSQSERH